MDKPTWRFITSRVDYFLAFGLGAGLSPRAPGTVGTLVGFPLYFFLNSYLSSDSLIAILAILYLLGIWICDSAGKAIGLADHPGIVWDEIVAFCLVLHYSPHNIYGYMAAFILFRFIDILKPWPIYLIDRGMENGFGVMFDDLLAALYAIGIIQLIF